jgi:FlaA1/EpsC-like NDP-sugar epimerase
MFKERARFYTKIQFASDLLLSCLAFPFAYFSRIYVVPLLPEGLGGFFNPLLLPFYDYLWMAGLGLVWWAIAAFSLGLYRISIRRFGWEKIRIIIESSILHWLFLGILSYALNLNISRPLITLFVVYQAGLLLFVRLVHMTGTRKKEASSPDGEFRNIVIVGSNARAHQMGELIARYSDWGFRILGYVDIEAQESVPRNGDVLG